MEKNSDQFDSVKVILSHYSIEIRYLVFDPIFRFNQIF